MKEEFFVFYKKPRLKNPWFIAGFSGWPDAGKVSSGTVSYLINKLRAEKFGKIKSEFFYDFSDTRPFTSIKKGKVEEYNPPRSEFYYWRSKNSPSDLLLLLGNEPHLRWDDYGEIIFSLCQEFKVRMLILLGGVYASVPHTREAITVVTTPLDPGLTKIIEEDTEWGEYEGPAAIHTLLVEKGKEKNIKVLSLWGNTPSYLQGWNPRVSYAVLKRILRITNLKVGIEDLKREGERLEEKINQTIARKPELKRFIKELETNFDLRRKSGTSDLIREIEEFLKREK